VLCPNTPKEQEQIRRNENQVLNSGLLAPVMDGLLVDLQSAPSRGETSESNGALSVFGRNSIASLKTFFGIIPKGNCIYTKVQYPGDT